MKAWFAVPGPEGAAFELRERPTLFVRRAESSAASRDRPGYEDQRRRLVAAEAMNPARPGARGGRDFGRARAAGMTAKPNASAFARTVWSVERITGGATSRPSENRGGEVHTFQGTDRLASGKGLSHTVQDRIRHAVEAPVPRRRGLRGPRALSVARIQLPRDGKALQGAADLGCCEFRRHHGVGAGERMRDPIGIARAEQPAEHGTRFRVEGTHAAEGTQRSPRVQESARSTASSGREMPGP